MLAVPALLAIGCLAALWMARGDARLFLIAQMLCVVWLGAMSLWFMNAMWVLPLFDLAVGLAAVAAWVERKSGWARSLVVLTFLRLTAHAANWLTDSAFFVGYAHVLNALFALQLIIVAGAGGADARRRLSDWLRFRRVGGLGESRTRGMSSVR